MIEFDDNTPDWMWDAYVVSWGSPDLDDYARSYYHWQMTLANLDELLDLQSQHQRR